MARRYILSFTAGGLLYHETIVIAETLLHAGFDWKATTERVVDENLLQSRTASTTDRKLREVGKRLEELTSDQIRLLVSGSRIDQSLLIWLACCLRYELLGDFAKEILRSKYLQRDLCVNSVDIEKFFESKTLWHEELEDLTATTKTKLQTVLFRMLRESGLITGEGLIEPPIMSRELSDALRSDSPERFDYFPMAAPERR